jgi:serine protease
VLGGLQTNGRPSITIQRHGVILPGSDAWELDSDTGAEYRRGEVLVRFRTGADAIARDRAVRTVRGRRLARPLTGDWNLVHLDPRVRPREAARALRASGDVVEVSLNYRHRKQQFRPNDEFYDLQWNFSAIDLPLAWEINPGARTDIVVAVLDTGLNTVTDTIVFSSPFGQFPLRFAAVPDLVADGRITNPRDFVYNDDLPADLDGHGTHVAGTVAQQTNNNFGVAGIAFNATLMPVKVLATSWDDVFSPGNPGGSTALIAEAIRYAADNGAKVINLSLGGPGPSPALRDAISYAVSRGAFVAIASGNSGDEGNPVEFPAAYGEEIRGAMAVGAVNRSLRRSVYSTFHSYVEICAPGGEMADFSDFDGGITQVTYPFDATLSFFDPIDLLDLLLDGFRPTFDRFGLLPFEGTSMAAPHVSGVAALLYSQGITNPAAIEEAIKRFAKPIDATAEECGAGLIDAHRTLRGLGLAR